MAGELAPSGRCLMTDTKPYLVAGEWRAGEETFEVKSPFDGAAVAEVGVPSDADVEDAVAAAADTFQESRTLPSYVRAEALAHISRRLAERVDEVAETIAREGGKPLKWATVEAKRASSTFRWAGEEARRQDGELLRLDAETELPDGMLSVLPLSGARAEKLVRDPRIAKVSFTGSGEVGWRLKGLEPKKHFTLELGGNAGAIVHSDADIDHAAARMAFGGYYQAGQSCIAVQRVLVHAPVYEDFVSRFVKQVESLKVGDPLDPETDVGPLIDAGALDRISEWVDEAVAQGAEVLTGSSRRDPFYEPTILANVTSEMKVCKEEVFGPVTTVTSYQTFEEALEIVNDSRYGLQAGVFTSDIKRAMLAHTELVVGGVIVNDVSAYRSDQMPYGGAKESGYGREGLRYAIEEMTEPRIMVLSDVSL